MCMTVKKAIVETGSYGVGNIISSRPLSYHLSFILIQHYTFLLFLFNRMVFGERNKVRTLGQMVIKRVPVLIYMFKVCGLVSVYDFKVLKEQESL